MRIGKIQKYRFPFIDLGITRPSSKARLGSSFWSRSKTLSSGSSTLCPPRT